MSASQGAGGQSATVPNGGPALAGGGASRPPNRVQVSWKGGQRFDASRPDGPAMRIDGTGETGQSPVDAVMSGLASCVAIDVVEIMAKRRTPVARLDIAVIGHRAEGTPRRLVAIELDFTMEGDGIDRDQATRAIDLGLNKYCSVRESLARDTVFSWSLTLNGETGASRASRA
jgi:putative redox protein